MSGIDQFFQENPQHIVGCKKVDGRTVIDTETLRALAQWAVEKGFTGKEKANEFLAFIDKTVEATP